VKNRTLFEDVYQNVTVGCGIDKPAQTLEEAIYTFCSHNPLPAGMTDYTVVETLTDAGVKDLLDSVFDVIFTF
jgi:hypothetical protein